MTDLATNVLCYVDNLDIPRRYLPETCGDLVYLDGISTLTSHRRRT